MKLAISNIAWEIHDDPLILKQLSELGVSGIEIAPTKVWPEWRDISKSSIENYRAKLSDSGFEIPSLQAILFGKPELNLFNVNCHHDFLEHIKLVTDIANGLGADVIVFGSPKNRKRNQVSLVDAENIAQDFFSKAGDICQQQGCKLGIEHNPVEYGCDFLTNIKDVSNFVSTLNHANVQLHVDSAGIHMCNDDIEQAILNSIPFIHYHISEPMLEPIANGVVNHISAATALKSISYSNWVSIEMKQPQSIDIVYESITKSITDYSILK